MFELTVRTLDPLSNLFLVARCISVLSRVQYFTMASVGGDWLLDVTEIEICIQHDMRSGGEESALLTIS